MPPKLPQLLVDDGVLILDEVGRVVVLDVVDIVRLLPDEEDELVAVEPDVLRVCVVAAIVEPDGAVLVVT